MEKNLIFLSQLQMSQTPMQGLNGKETDVFFASICLVLEIFCNVKVVFRLYSSYNYSLFP